LKEKVSSSWAQWFITVRLAIGTWRLGGDVSSRPVWAKSLETPSQSQLIKVGLRGAFTRHPSQTGKTNGKIMVQAGQGINVRIYLQNI
jgi:hypothetical protein